MCCITSGASPAGSRLIAGAVNAVYEPVVTLVVQGPAGETLEIDAVIDTGFTGFLTVTPALARRIEADAADTTPLVGMRLLERHVLNVEVEIGGRVLIQGKGERSE